MTEICERIYTQHHRNRDCDAYTYMCVRMCVHHVMFALDMSTCGVSVTGSTERGNTRGACRVQICCVCVCTYSGHQCCREGLVISS